MNIPGFTAEATISTAPKHWSSATVGSHETAETVVVPQVDVDCRRINEYLQMATFFGKLYEQSKFHPLLCEQLNYLEMFWTCHPRGKFGLSVVEQARKDNNCPKKRYVIWA